MSGPVVMTLGELSQLTGKPEDWWRRNWLRMHDRHGFPRRLPGLWAWPRATVEAWVEVGGRRIEAPAPANTNLAPDVAMSTELLERRFNIAPAIDGGRP